MRFFERVDAGFAFAGDEEGGVVEFEEEGCVGVVGGEEVGDEEAGSFEAPGWVGHRMTGW